MGWWAGYFFAKLLLYAGGYIDFDVWWNFLFAVFTALPARNDRQRLTKNMIASAVSVVLLYHDSWLPPLGRVLSQTEYIAEFSLPYLVELLGRLFNFKLVLELAVMLAIFALFKRKLRMATFVFIGIFTVMAWPAWVQHVQAISRADTVTGAVSIATASAESLRNLSGPELEQRVAQFFAGERRQRVHFQRAANDGPPYDIVLLHVCSLSWDDLNEVGQHNDPLLQRFDVMFTRFNTAASYSGPAAIRLLRGNCGQTRQKELYEAPSRDCLVMDGLQQVGFKPYWAMNHDGHFGNFFADVRERGGMPVPLQDSSGARVAQRSFDGTPIYDDLSVLSQWWRKRLTDPAERVALYYNTISLHDGNRLEGKSLRESGYAVRLDLFAKNLNGFLDELQRSGRRVIVVFIPEHGAALRGDRRQIQGLREIPTPAITQVPVGVALINARRSEGAEPSVVDTPASYLAVNELLSRFVTDNPFGRLDLRVSDYLKQLPMSDSIAENEGTLMFSQGSQAMLRTPDGVWSEWDDAT